MPRRLGDTRYGTAGHITAGTSDLPVAEEARETVEWMGVSTVMIHDVGVAAHRRDVRAVGGRSASGLDVVMTGDRQAVVAELIAQLMWGPKCRQELIDATGMHRNSVERWVQAFVASGIVCVAERRGQTDYWTLSRRPHHGLTLTQRDKLAAIAALLEDV